MLILRKLLYTGNEGWIESKVKDALNEGVEARDILAKGLIGSMSVITERFSGEDMFLPEV